LNSNKKALRYYEELFCFIARGYLKISAHNNLYSLMQAVYSHIYTLSSSFAKLFFQKIFGKKIPLLETGHG
jgi:hypothetical protein